MPVTIQTNKVKFKDPNNQGFITLDAIGSESAQEIQSKINGNVNNAIKNLNDATAAANASANTIAQAVSAAVAQGTDTTLTLSGVPADAKVTGDSITDLKNACNNRMGIAIAQPNSTIDGRTQNPSDTGAFYEKSNDEYGNYNIKYRKTRGFVFISPILGRYNDISTSKFLVKITSNGEVPAFYECLLCRGSEWGNTNTGVIFSNTLLKGRSAYHMINIADYDGSIFSGNAYVYLIIRNQQKNNDGNLVDLDVHITKNPSTVSFADSIADGTRVNMEAMSINNPSLLIPFESEQWLYKGVNTATFDSIAMSSVVIDGFDRLGSPSSGTIAVAKKIQTDYFKIPVLQNNTETIELDIYFDYDASRYQYLLNTTVFLSTGIDWSGNQSVAFAIKTVVPGWNRFELGYRTSGSSSEYYKYLVVQQGYPDYNNLIKGVYIHWHKLNHDVNDSKYAEYAMVGQNAGYRAVDYNPAVNVVGTLSAGNITYTRSVGKVTVDCSEGVSASGYCYPVVAYPIKQLFGTGAKLRVTVTNSAKNSNTWYWNTCRFCTAASSWGGAATLQPITLSDMGNMLAEKATFTIDLDNFITFDPSGYASIYFLIASFRNSPVNIPANTISVEAVVIDKDNRVIATELDGFKQSDYYTKAEVNSLIGETSTEAELVAWGDSLTAGAGGSGTTYIGVCASELGGLTYKNYGVGGETANTIAARQGGNMIVIPAGAVNGTYALNDLADIFGYHVNPLRQGNGSNSGNKLYINGYEANLAITQSSATAQDATYTISGYNGPALIIPTFARFAGCSFNGKIVIIWVGQNGSSVEGISDNVDARIAIIDSMISHIGHNRYVILGMSSGTASSRDAEDKKLLAKYGNKFFPTRRLLANYGMTINGLTPTSQDETEIAAGGVPASLRYDTVHLNAYGYTALGKLLAQKIRALGYIK